MARKKKYRYSDPKIYNEKPESLDGLKKLKEGTVVMYRTTTLFDKCTVQSTDKKEGTAMLSNGVKVSRGIQPDGRIIRLGHTTENTLIKVWDEECEKDYDYFKSKYFFREFAEKVRKLADNRDRDYVLTMYNKLKRVSEKYEF